MGSNKLSKLLNRKKMLEMGRFAKVLLTLVSMTISVVVYSFLFRPWFAIGLVLLLLVHELGHVLAARRKGYLSSAPIFIPLFGAMVVLPDCKSPDEQAYIAFGGPLVGGISALVVFAMWYISGCKNESLLILSATGTFLNLTNLVPIRPFDGGLVVQVIRESSTPTRVRLKWLGLYCLLLAGLVVFLVLQIPYLPNTW